MTAPSVTGDGETFDLVVIGSGSAAFAAAITASDAGRSVALIEERKVGGTCVNVGCVPSKALLAAAGAHGHAAANPFAGVATSAGPVDMAAIVAQKDRLVEELRAAKYVDVADTYEFAIVPGHAQLEAPTTLRVGDRRIHANRVIIASGVDPVIPAIEGLSDVPYLTSTTALGLTVVPAHLVVIGANAIGLELGQAFLHLGSRVTFLEAAPTVAPSEEPEVIDAITGVLIDEGASIRTGVSITRATRDGDDIVVALQDGATVRGSHLLVAAGRRPSFAGMGLEEAGVALDERGYIRVDDKLRTTATGVFAAGDVAGLPQFVYVAARSGSVAASNAFAASAESMESIDLTALPRIVFTTPQIAVAGMTDDEANRLGYTCECRVLPLGAVPRALVNQKTRGVVKIVAHAQTRTVLGVSLVADGAGEVILAAVYAIKFGVTVEQLAATWAPYLTMGEALKLAAQTFTRDVSTLSCCAA